MKHYVLVGWPEIQDFMVHERWNADALNDSLCSLEQNNYMDAEYLMPIIRQQITNIQNSLILLS